MRFQAKKLCDQKLPLTPERITEILNMGRNNLICGLENTSQDVSFGKNMLKIGKRTIKGKLGKISWVSWKGK